MLDRLVMIGAQGEHYTELIVTEWNVWKVGLNLKLRISNIFAHCLKVNMSGITSVAERQIVPLPVLLKHVDHGLTLDELLDLR